MLPISIHASMHHERDVQYVTDVTRTMIKYQTIVFCCDEGLFILDWKLCYLLIIYSHLKRQSMDT